MAESRIAEYCCKRGYIGNYTSCISPSGGSCGGKTYDVIITSVTSGSNFGIYTPSFILSRTCLTHTNCIAEVGCPSGSAIKIDISSGCFPYSIFPITVHYKITENGSQIDTNSIALPTIDCPDGSCGDVCNQIPT